MELHLVHYKTTRREQYRTGYHLVAVVFECNLYRGFPIRHERL